jgi:2-keto-3-deoxy-L-rhamnonate aldolase RhmA
MPALPQWGTLARGQRRFGWLPGCFARSWGRSNYLRFLNSIPTLSKHVVQMGPANVEAIAALEGIDMIAHGHSGLSAPWRSSPA